MPSRRHETPAPCLGERVIYIRPSRQEVRNEHKETAAARAWAAWPVVLGLDDDGALTCARGAGRDSGPLTMLR